MAQSIVAVGRFDQTSSWTTRMNPILTFVLLSTVIIAVMVYLYRRERSIFNTVVMLAVAALLGFVTYVVFTDRIHVASFINASVTKYLPLFLGLLVAAFVLVLWKPVGNAYVTHKTRAANRKHRRAERRQQRERDADRARAIKERRRLSSLDPRGEFDLPPEETFDSLPGAPKSKEVLAHEEEQRAAGKRLRRIIRRS